MKLTSHKIFFFGITLIVCIIYFLSYLQPIARLKDHVKDTEKRISHHFDEAVENSLIATVDLSIPPDVSREDSMQKSVAPMPKGSLNLIHTSLTREVSNHPLLITGNVPTWLEGALLRVGPALFECKDAKAKTWFDGCSMVHRFAFSQGSIAYSNRFLYSDYWHQVHDEGIFGMKGQNQKKGFFSKLGSLMSGSSTPSYDNGNTNLCCINGQYCALTETPLYLTFDEKTLASGQHLPFNDTLMAHYACAHGHLDQKTGNYYSYLIQFGNTSTYIVYKIPSQSTKRIPIAKINASYPAYMHSFAMTEHYLILIEPPFRVNPLDLVFGSATFFETYTWKSKQQTIITVLDKKTGKTINTYKTDPFFFLHQINAYEEKETLIIDLVSYHDPLIVTSFNLHEWYKNGQRLPKGYPTRLTINLNRRDVHQKRLSNLSMEMPRINYAAHNTKPYAYVYGVHIPEQESFTSHIIKLEVKSGKTFFWHENDCYPSEPVFIARPGGKTEDDGVLVTPVLDLRSSTSFLLILDARNMKELARAHAPHHIPFDSHGYFFTFNGH